MRRMLIGLLAGAAVSAAVPTTAEARVMISPRPPGEWVWVEPVYRIEYDRVWVPTRTERIPERVWVAATYGWRTVRYYDESGRCIERREWGEISPARWETRYREVVVEGRYEMRERRVLVSGGHWRPVGPRPPVFIDPPVVYRPNPGTVGVEGYARGGGGDSGKFTPLYEWPK